MTGKRHFFHCKDFALLVCWPPLFTSECSRAIWMRLKHILIPATPDCFRHCVGPDTTKNIRKENKSTYVSLNRPYPDLSCPVIYKFEPFEARHSEFANGVKILQNGAPQTGVHAIIVQHNFVHLDNAGFCGSWRSTPLYAINPRTDFTRPQGTQTDLYGEARPR